MAAPIFTDDDRRHRGVRIRAARAAMEAVQHRFDVVDKAIRNLRSKIPYDIEDARPLIFLAVEECSELDAAMALLLEAEKAIPPPPRFKVGDPVRSRLTLGHGIVNAIDGRVCVFWADDRPLAWISEDLLCPADEPMEEDAAPQRTPGPAGVYATLGGPFDVPQLVEHECGDGTVQMKCGAECPRCHRVIWCAIHEPAAERKAATMVSGALVAAGFEVRHGVENAHVMDVELDGERFSIWIVGARDTVKVIPHGD